MIYCNKKPAGENSRVFVVLSKFAWWELSRIFSRNSPCCLRAPQAIFRASNPKNRLGNTPRGFPQTPFLWGKNSCFSPRPPLALANAFARLRREWRRFAPSASGGLKPFSEEKGFKTSKKTFVRFAMSDSCAAKRKGCSVTLPAR